MVEIDYRHKDIRGKSHILGKVVSRACWDIAYRGTVLERSHSVYNLAESAVTAAADNQIDVLAVLARKIHRVIFAFRHQRSCLNSLFL